MHKDLSPQKLGHPDRAIATGFNMFGKLKTLFRRKRIVNAVKTEFADLHQAPLENMAQIA